MNIFKELDYKLSLLIQRYIDLGYEFEEIVNYIDDLLNSYNEDDFLNE